MTVKRMQRGTVTVAVSRFNTATEEHKYLTLKDEEVLDEWASALVCLALDVESIGWLINSLSALLRPEND